MNCDCHIHMVLDGVYWKAAIGRHRQQPDIPWIRNTLETYRKAGFTYLRDGGDRWGVGAAARELAPEYGITYKTPLAPIFHKGHYGGLLGLSYETMPEFARLVRGEKEKGADFIKIMVSGLMDFDRCGVLTEEGLPGEEIREMVHIIHEEGMAVMIHGNGAHVGLAAAEAGAESLEHGAYLDRDAMQAMQEQKTVWVPTLSTIGNLRGTGRFDEENVEKILETAQKNLRYFAEIGGAVAVGSDAGAWAVPHGISTEETLLRETLGAQADEILCRGNQLIRQRF